MSLVTIKSVTRTSKVSGANKPYTVYSVTYVQEEGEYAGQEKTKNVFESNEELVSKLKAIKPDTKKELTFKKSPDGFWNIVDVGDPSPEGSSSTKSKTYTKKASTGGSTTNSKPFDNVGAQVGGALHDAVAVALARKGSKVTTLDIEQAALEILILQENLKSQLSAGTLSSLKERATPLIEDVEYDDEELPE